jgi:hypothetical protein
MLFTYITDLPPQVRGVLDVNLQQIWLDTFNASLAVSPSEVEAYQAAWFKVFQVAFPGQVALPTDLPQMQPPPPAAPEGAPQAGQAVSASERPSFGHWVDLSGATFDDLNRMTWVQALPVGEYSHPTYGAIKVTPERVAQFANNVNVRTRGTDLDIDYDHKDYSGKAAGWVKAASAKQDGLWIQVEWTEDAYNSLKKREYRYFSPEFADEWEHPKTKVKYKDVLFGGALTNRPFLKDILPINMSEVFRFATGGRMDPLKEIAKLLGLPDDASAEQILGAIRIKQQQEPDPNQPDPNQPDPNQPPADPNNPPEGQPAPPQAVSASEGLKKLAETNPELAAMLTEREETNKRLAALETANRLSEVTIRLNELQANQGNKYAIPPAVLNTVKEAALLAPKQFNDRMFGMLESLLKTGLVPLTESGGREPEPNSSAIMRFQEKVDALTQDGKMEYVDAVSQVAMSDPDLFEAYRDESFANETFQ